MNHRHPGRRGLWGLGFGVLSVLLSGGLGAGEVTLPAGQNLRGFGSVRLALDTLYGENGNVAVLRFHTAGPDRARLLAHKFLADLAQSAHAPGFDDQRFYVTAGGRAFAVTLDGAVATLHGAPSPEVLARVWAEQPPPGELVGGPGFVPEYPEYMNRFAWGLYGLANVEDWVLPDTKERIRLDPVEDLDFLKQMNGMGYDSHLDISLYNSGDGIVLNRGQHWKRKYGQIHSHRVYVNAGNPDWTARRFPEYVNQPAPFLQSGWLGYGLWAKATPHFSWYAPDIQRYLGRHTQDMMLAQLDDPANRGWMHPHGELVRDAWFDLHDDYSPTARRHWVEYLKTHKVTLEEISAMFLRENSPFLDFEQVPIPEFATFAGWPGLLLDLAGDWRVKADRDRAPPGEDRAAPPATRYPGLRDAWYAPDFDDGDWTVVTMPGGEGLFDLIEPVGPVSRNGGSLWFRRAFDYHPAPAGDRRVYLYFFPASAEVVHGGRTPEYHKFFLNGKPVGEIGSWGALDVTDTLRPGMNRLAFQLLGAVWNGRIFLSTETPAAYPNLGPARNRLWNLWQQWHIDAKFDGWAAILEAMRAVDGERPIKFMAPVGFGAAKWLELATRYGGYPHFTGEGMWFYPWYKRYAKLYGLPATSELAGLSYTVDQNHEGFRRTFLAGLDGHEPVFLTQTYSRDPAVRAWWLAHKEIMSRMGKYDIDGPQILLYRTEHGQRGAGLKQYPVAPDAPPPHQKVYDWDLGRGTLQTLGQSCLYLDDNGVFDGKINGYPLIVDCGNETLDPAALAKIRAWVEAGGTFVALPFTGRHAPEEAYAWPASELTGLAVRERPLGGRVTIAPAASLFKAHAGATFDDHGRSLDHLGNNLNRHSAELIPLPGCDIEVLATFENGAPAVALRRLGKGRVLTFGSVFWRAAEDRRGLWWPEEIETRFVADMLAGLGFPAARGESSDRLIWAQPYRSNNGLDQVTVLVNWNEDGVQTPTLTLRPPARPSRMVSHGVDGVNDLPFVWDEAAGTATLTVAMPAREVKTVSAEAFAPENAMLHWWTRQNELWRELPPARFDRERYLAGKWADPVQDLSARARFTNHAPANDDWTRPGFDDAHWTESRADILNFWGAAPEQPAWLRISFQVDPAWRAGGDIHLISGMWANRHYLTPTRLLINGVELHAAGRHDHYNEFDVGPHVRAGENVIAFALDGGQKYIGLAGNVFLYHRPAPLRSLDMSGVWVDADGQTLTVPGRATVRWAARTLALPKEWEGRYQLRWRSVGNAHSIQGVRVNGRLVRRHHLPMGPYGDLDITHAVRFGEDNLIELVGTNECHGRSPVPQPLEIQSLSLDLYPALEP